MVCYYVQIAHNGRHKDGERNYKLSVKTVTTIKMAMISIAKNTQVVPSIFLKSVILFRFSVSRTSNFAFHLG